MREISDQLEFTTQKPVKHYVQRERGTDGPNLIVVTNSVQQEKDNVILKRQLTQAYNYKVGTKTRQRKIVQPKKIRNENNKPEWNADTKVAQVFDKNISKTSLFPYTSKKTTHSPDNIYGNRSIPVQKKITQSFTQSFQQKKKAIHSYSTIKSQGIKKNPSTSYTNTQSIYRQKSTLNHSQKPKVLKQINLETNTFKKISPNQEVEETISFPIVQSGHILIDIFTILDSKKKGAIDSYQIYHGLDMLGLSCSIKEIEDFIFVVNDGKSNLVEFEDWKVFVDALRSTSSVVISNASSIEDQSPLRNESTSISTEEDHESLIINTNQSPEKPSLNQELIEEKSFNVITCIDKGCDPMEFEVFDNQKKPQLIQVIDEQTCKGIDQNDPKKNIPSRMDPVDIASLLSLSIQNSSKSNMEHHPLHLLEQAESLVQSLKISLFPLMGKAENKKESMMEKSKYEKENINYFSMNDKERIKHHSDMFVDLLIDDLLQDTVDQLSFDEEKKIQKIEIIQEEKQLLIISKTLEKLEENEQELYNKWYLNYNESINNYMDMDQISSKNIISLSSPKEIIQQPKYIIMDSIQRNVNLNKLQIQLIESNKQEYLRYRNFVESSLISTGYKQYEIIEIMEEALMDNILYSCVQEMYDVFHIYSERFSKTI